MTRATTLCLGLAMVALLVPADAPAQSANTRPANTNRSANLKSGIFRGSGNLIQGNSRASFIGAGQRNTIFSRVTNGVIGGGFGNRLGGHFGFVGGGLRNNIQTNSSGSVIAGGVSNNVAPDAPMAVVGGGVENFITNNSTASLIGGGVANIITATNRPLGTIELSTVAAAATIAGGVGNTAAGHKSAIGGGWGNITGEDSYCAVVGGGRGNIVFGSYSSILGGDENQITFGDSSTIVGGTRNKIERFDFIIPERTSGVFMGGGDGNKASADHAVIAGGRSNFSEGVASFIGGGFSNSIGKPVADTFGSVIGGGGLNSVSGAYGFIGGGDRNTNSGNYATVGGGTFNAARGLSSTVAGGASNTASGENATVGGGYTNFASAYAATIPGGVFCKATNSGSFVWSGDASETTSSWGDHTFTVRAEGGVRFYTANGTNIGAFLGPNGSWHVASDSNLKTKVTAVDPRAILYKVAAMPVTEWEYKALPSRRYIGPMAQDFRAAFGLGDDDKSISTLDSDGVMYAAIQGLVEELKERDKEIAELKTKSSEVDALRSDLRALREQIEGMLPHVP